VRAAAPLRVGVVGVGRWGRNHVRVYSQLPGARLTAVVSPELDVARELGRAWGVPAFAHHGELIGRVDAASIAAPTLHHFAIARDLLEAGVHVLVEKPITTRVEEARELIELARRKGCVLAVGHLERFKPAVEALLERIGEPLEVRAHRVRPAGNGPVQDVGVVLDLMIHDLDLLLALGRSPLAEAQGLGVRVHGPDEDLALVRARLASGCRASLAASRMASDRSSVLEVTTADGHARLDFLAGRLELRRGARREMLEFEPREPLALELAHFVECARGAATPRVRGEDGLAALEAALRVRAALAPRPLEAVR
jgi:predicted dehydrogenase